jgi:hypothetical protein
MCLFVTVNLMDSGNKKVDMTHFDVLQLLGTGGKNHDEIIIFFKSSS